MGDREVAGQGFEGGLVAAGGFFPVGCGVFLVAGMLVVGSSSSSMEFSPAFWIGFALNVFQAFEETGEFSRVAPQI